MTEPHRAVLPVRDASAGPAGLTLTPAGEPPRLRADAARNRRRLLEVAAELAAEHGAANVTMEAVAAAAEVGKGTVFRRFGDRTGLMLALIDHIEQQIQAAFLTGPPPLGPDAPPLERLRAFGPAVMRHEHAHRDLYLAARREQSRRFNPSYQLRLTHLTLLLRQSGAPGDVELTGHTLQAYLDTVLVEYLLTARGMPIDRLDAGWHDLVDRLGTPR
ncbi:TetR/AcrR family transcriptional regulator [Streptomyces sp. NPDC059718]